MRKKRYQQGSLQKRKHGRYLVWVVLWRDESGSRRYRTLGRCSKMTHAEAMSELNTIVEPLNRAGGVKLETHTFGRFVKSAYLPFYLRKWKSSTAITSSNRIDQHLVADFGQRLLGSIRRDELQDFLERKAAAGLSFSIVDHLRWDLRSIFEMALNDDVVQKNPARGLFTPRTAVCAVQRVMDAKEVQKCLSVFDLREELIVRLAVFVGMRPGEIFALEWLHVKDDHLEVRQRIYKGELDSPKSRRSTRIVGLSPGTAAAFMKWREACPVISSEAWVFPSERLTTAIAKENCWRRNIEPRLKAVGLGWVNFQVMRRTHSTLSRKFGIDPKVVADQMGHGLGVNLDVYTQADLEQLTAGVSRLESQIIQ